MTGSAKARDLASNAATVAPKPLSVNVDLGSDKVFAYSDPTGVVSAKVTRAREKNAGNDHGHRRTRSSGMPLRIGTNTVAPFHIDTQKIFKSVANAHAQTPRSASGPTSPLNRVRKPLNFAEYLEQTLQESLALPGVPEDPNSHRNNSPHAFRKYQSAGTTTGAVSSTAQTTLTASMTKEVTSPPPPPRRGNLMQTISLSHGSKLESMFFNSDGTLLRQSPGFEKSQSHGDDKDNGTSTIKRSLALSSISRARSYRDVKKLDETDMDIFIRITHYISANIEVYKRAKETIPDCLRGMRQVIQQHDVADVKTQINALRLIALSGADYVLETTTTCSCSGFMSLFARQPRQPAVINETTQTLLELLQLPSKDPSFIAELNIAYRAVMALLPQSSLTTAPRTSIVVKK